MENKSGRKKSSPSFFSLFNPCLFVQLPLLFLCGWLNIHWPPRVTTHGRRKVNYFYDYYYYYFELSPLLFDSTPAAATCKGRIIIYREMNLIITCCELISNSRLIRRRHLQRTTTQLVEVQWIYYHRCRPRGAEYYYCYNDTTNKYILHLLHPVYFPASPSILLPLTPFACP